MKINVTIDITREELLRAVTTAIEQKHRYDYKFPSGSAKSIELVGDVFRVVWGAPEVEEIEQAPPPAVVVDEPKTELVAVEPL